MIRFQCPAVAWKEGADLPILPFPVSSPSWDTCPGPGSASMGERLRTGWPCLEIHCGDGSLSFRCNSCERHGASHGGSKAGDRMCGMGGLLSPKTLTRGSRASAGEGLGAFLALFSNLRLSVSEP